MPKLEIRLGTNPAIGEEVLDRLRESPPRRLVDPKAKP
jgi:hypothetical protein